MSRAVKLSLLAFGAVALLLAFFAYVFGSQYQASWPKLTVLEQSSFKGEQALRELSNLKLETGASAADVWHKLTLLNTNDKALNFYFNPEHNQISFAEVYIATDNGWQVYVQDVSSHDVSNNSEHSGTEELTQNNLDFNLHFEAGQQRQVLIRFQSYFHHHIHLDFYSYEQYLWQKSMHTGALIVVIALMILIGLVNLLFIYALKERYHVYYLMQLLTLSMFVLFEFGFFGSDGRSVTVIGQASVAAGLLFTTHFLALNQYFPRAFKAIRAVAIFLIITLPLFYWVLTISFALSKFIVVAFSTLVIVPVVFAVILYRRGIYYVLPFIFGGMAITVCTGLFVGRLLDFYQAELIPHYGWIYLGVVLESLLVLVAISMKIDRAKRQQQSYYQELQQVYVKQIEDTKVIEKQTQLVMDAQDKAQSKDTQLATTSHDIHHHLYVMKLNITALGGKQNEQVDALKQSVDYLRDMTDGILQASYQSKSQQKSQQTSSEVKGFDFRGFMAQLETDFAPVAGAHGVEIRFCCFADVKLFGSDVLLRRVMDNLLNNGIVYAGRSQRKNKVLVSARRRGNGMELGVYDTGRGISEHHITELFELFNRGDTPVQEGFGLGLYIASSLCRQAGFKLNVKSIKGRGSVFSVRINNIDGY